MLATIAADPVIRTLDQRVRVFVSSTLQELAAERAAVRDAVTQLRLVPVMFERPTSSARSGSTRAITATRRSCSPTG